MSGQQGDRVPKTLQDVSHLFFSRDDGGEPSEAEPSDAGSSVTEDPAEAGVSVGVEPGPPEVSASAPEARSGEGHWSRTLVIPVTGGGRPGVSTVSVNLAHALLPWGRVGLFDADPRLPNARFYLGLPSSHYLRHLTGGGPAATTIIDGGLVVGEWVSAGTGPDVNSGSGEALYVDVEGAGRRALDIVVADIPLDRLELLAPIRHLAPAPVLVARHDFEGLVEAYEAASALAAAGFREPVLVVNGTNGPDEGARFAAKMKEACRRLLGMEIRFAGALRREPRLGSIQRERGPIVRSEPDSVAALSLRETAANVLSAARGENGLAGAARAAQREVQP